MREALGGGILRIALILLLLTAVAPSCTLRSRGDEPPDTVAFGAPPFYRHSEWDVHSRWDRHEKTNILFPLYRSFKTPDRAGMLLFPLFWKREFYDGDGNVDSDWTLLPFFTGGSDPEDGDHFLFFPFWGTTKETLGKDVMRFRFFPFYLDAVQDEYESVHVLWPLISWGDGGGRSDFRIMPFYSRDDHEGRAWARSVIWPFVTWGQESLNSQHPTDVVFVFPFYGHSISAVHKSQTFLWPFFSTSDNIHGYTDVNAPWPIYRNMRAPDGRYSWRIWPIVGSMRDKGEEEDFFLWPLFWRTKRILPYGGSLTHNVVPFYRNTQYLSDPAVENADRGRMVQFWPFYRRIRDVRGAVYVRTLALMPFKGWTDIKANLGWLWTLYEYYEDEDTEKAALLSGLLGYENSPEGGKIRLLWFIDIPF